MAKILAAVGAMAMVVMPIGGAASGAASAARTQPTELIAAGPTATYVLAATPCRPKDCLSLYRSTAAGITRVTLPAGAARQTSYGPAPDLVFSGRNDGYAIVGIDTASERAWKTTNGARTWRRAALPGHVFSVVAADRRFTAVVASCTARRCTDDRVASQPVGGSRWTTARLPGSAIAPNGPAQLDAGSFALAAAGRRVWVYRPDLFRVTISSNAGRTFGPLLNSTAGGLSDQMTASSTSTVWCECDTGMMDPILRSTDGGVQFSQLGRRTTPGGTSGFVFTALSASRALYSPGLQSRAVELTTDGGQRFRTIGRLPLKPGSARQWAFRTDRDGLLIGYAGSGNSEYRTMWATRNGGRSWSSVTLPADR